MSLLNIVYRATVGGLAMYGAYKAGREIYESSKKDDLVNKTKDIVKNVSDKLHSVFNKENGIHLSKVKFEDEEYKNKIICSQLKLFQDILDSDDVTTEKIKEIIEICESDYFKTHATYEDTKKYIGYVECLANEKLLLKGLCENMIKS